MVWPLKERRGPKWKQGWTMSTLSSISAPPLQLVAIVGIVMFLLLVPSYINFKSTMQTATISFNLVLLFLPLVLILIAQAISRHGSRLVIPVPLYSIRRALAPTRTGAGGSPCGVAALVVLLLFLAFFRSNFRSMWSPLIWRSY